MSRVLDILRGGLIVSVQARAGSALDNPSVIASMAQAAVAGGAVGLRIQGSANLRAVRPRVDVPILGLIKRAHEGFEPYITSTLEEVASVLDAGADIVAFDATGRPRPGGLTTDALIEAIEARGGLAMADCACAADGLAAQAAGATIVATTLCGYTAQTQGCVLPALDVVRELAELETYVICEGGIHAPADVAAALEAGAHSIVVGTAITDIEWLVREFAAPADKRRHR